MKNDKRACFALIAATIVNKHRYNGVRDLCLGTFASIITSSMSDSYLSFFDYSRGGYVSGNKMNLYDYPTSSHVSMIVNGHQINCFDYEIANYVQYTVNGNNVMAYDYQSGKNYQYIVI